MLYDSADRVVATLHPNQTWTKVVFDAWRQASWDVNDTLLIADPRTDADVGDRSTRLLGTAPGAWTSWHDQRIGGALGAAEQAAAKNTEPHAATPSVVHVDSLGRTCLAIADNGKDGRYPTRTASDVETKPLAILDALGRRVFEYCLREPAAGGGFQYVAGRDLAGHALYHCGMDGGERRVLPDVTGKPIRAWDALGRAFELRYDLLRRPTHRYVTVNATTILLERSIYGEGMASQNLCGRLFRHYDQAGLASNDAFDYKGNLAASTRQLAAEYRNAVDWTVLANLTDPAALDAAAKPKLVDADRFSATSTYDALNRVIQTVTPHSGTMKPNVIRPAYNEANLLDRIDVWQQQPTAPTGLLDPATATLHAVTAIEYDAHGKRTAITFGNVTVTTYAYDPLTFRLARLVTTRPSSFPANARTVQDLTYTYDPAGNITHIQDDADIQNVVYFRNQRVEPSSDYAYDAIYRLVDRDGSRAPRPDERAAESSAADHERRRLPHRPAAARRRQCDGHLHGEVSVRSGRQPARADACRLERQLDAPLRVQRAVADHGRGDEQPADVDELAGRPGGGSVLGHVRARCARQHDAHAAPAGDGMGRA